jgi:hypothetical protein
VSPSPRKTCGRGPATTLAILPVHALTVAWFSGWAFWPGGVRLSNVPDMEGLAAAVVLVAILLGVVLVAAFDVVCLVHLAAADRARFLPKSVWAVLIVCTSPLGGAAYLLCRPPRHYITVRQ